MVRIKGEPVYYCDKCFDELRAVSWGRAFYYEILPEEEAPSQEKGYCKDE